MASSPKGEGKIWSEEFPRNRLERILLQQDSPGLNPPTLSKACRRQREQGNISSSHPLPNLAKSPLLRPAPSESLVSYGSPHPFAQPERLISIFPSGNLKSKWKLPLEDSGACVTLGRGQRFKINAFLTDSFFIYTFPQELSFQCHVPGGGHTSSVAPANLLVIKTFLPTPWQQR